MKYDFVDVFIVVNVKLNGNFFIF